MLLSSALNLLHVPFRFSRLTWFQSKFHTCAENVAALELGQMCTVIGILNFFSVLTVKPEHELTIVPKCLSKLRVSLLELLSEKRCCSVTAKQTENRRLSFKWTGWSCKMHHCGGHHYVNEVCQISQQACFLCPFRQKTTLSKKSLDESQVTLHNCKETGGNDNNRNGSCLLQGAIDHL